MRITRSQLRQIIQEALETLEDSSVTFHPGDIVEIRRSGSGLWQIIAIDGASARLRAIGSMLDTPSEMSAPLDRLMKSNKNA